MTDQLAVPTIPGGADGPLPTQTTIEGGGLLIEGLGKVLGGRAIVDDLTLEVAKGELVCFLGPSGCGKTTTLRMVAGFLEPDAGRVLIGGKDVTKMPPERRPTAMVFQSYALWPHMTVFDNVAFPLTLRRLGRTEVKRRAEEMLEVVGLSHHLKSKPARISGGEQQRVALARALVQEPQVLLLDEPLSNLDAKLRMRVREDIRALQQRLGITTVVVTHDQDEALSMSDRVAVMNNGRIEQVADPVTLYRDPHTLFVASFVGSTNTIDSLVTADGSRFAVSVGGVPVPVLAANLAPGGASAAGDTVLVRPEDVTVTPAGTAGAARARVRQVVPRGHFAEVLLEVGAAGAAGAVASGGGAQPVTIHAYAEPGAQAGGDEVGVVVKRALVYRDGSLVA